MGKAVSKVFGGGGVDKAQQRKQLELQRQQLEQQQAIAERNQNSADEEEKRLSGIAASQRRAQAAKARSRGGLAFTGPNSNLKSTLGG